MPMPDKGQMLETIHAALAARQRGDMDAIHQYLAPAATFRLVGAPEAPKVPVGYSDAREAVADLIELFEFHAIEPVHIVVEGHVAVVHWHVRASTGGGEQFATELCDIWTFDDDGKIKSLVEFADTAKMAQMLA